MNKIEDSYAFLKANDGLQRGDMATYVADQLRQAIISSHLPPGTMLDKMRICERLNVSRTPVVDAFARLRNEGFVEILPQRGTTVTYLSMAAIEELVLIRKGLECQAVYQLAGTMTAEFTAQLRENLAAQEAAARRDDKEGFYQLDSQFHDMLARPLSYKRLAGMLEMIRNNLSRARRMTNTPFRLSEGHKEHVQIVDALEKSDGLTAALLMDAHLDGITFDVSRLATSHPELFRDDTTIR